MRVRTFIERVVWLVVLAFPLWVDRTYTLKT